MAMRDNDRFPATREEIQERIRLLKSEFGKLYDELLAVFFNDDPIGINFDVNTDEYAPEVRTILPRLRECKTEDDARNLIHEEFTHWFGDAGPEARYAAVASQVWQKWQSFNKERD